MNLICLEDYSDTMYRLKVGDNTADVHSMTEEHKKSILKDFPHKFKVADELKDSDKSELVIENTDPIFVDKSVKYTKKAAKAKE